MNKYLKHYVLLLLIVGLAVFFRFIGINWDQGQHLHPDERFLTMVGNAMKIPVSIAEYLNPSKSPMNPSNIGFAFYVYGTLPVVLNKLLAVWLNADTYSGFTLMGRALSACADIITLLFLYRIILLLEKQHHLHSLTKYAAVFFYAIAVFPIQVAHFFAVDTFLTCFILGSVYFSLRFSYFKSYPSVFFTALFFGLAVSSKINAVLIAPVIGIFFLQGLVKQFELKRSSFSIDILKPQMLMKLIVIGLLFLSVSYVTIRLCSPYLFADNNFFNPAISKTFLQNLGSLKAFDGKDTWFPPGIQWINKPPVLFSLINVAFFGLGLPYFIFVIVGSVYLFTRIRKFPFFVLFVWVLGIFFYQSIQFVKTMRYLIILYPFFAMFAGIGFVYLTKKWHSAIRIAIVIIILIWPLSFLSIYLNNHSRVTASKWIHRNLPNGSVIANEHWDDWLPISLPNFPNKQFTGEQLPVFDADTPEKWERMETILAKSDYYILTSNRGWGSIPTVPEKYPKMSQFYKDLFAGKRGFKKIAEFTSYPSLRYLGIPLTINDDWSDEAFTVYDHPKVMLFQRIKNQ